LSLGKIGVVSLGGTALPVHQRRIFIASQPNSLAMRCYRHLSNFLCCTEFRAIFCIYLYTSSFPVLLPVWNLTARK